MSDPSLPKAKNRAAQTRIKYPQAGPPPTPSLNRSRTVQNHEGHNRRDKIAMGKVRMVPLAKQKGDIGPIEKNPEHEATRDHQHNTKRDHFISYQTPPMAVLYTPKVRSVMLPPIIVCQYVFPPCSPQIGQIMPAKDSPQFFTQRGNTSGPKGPAYFSITATKNLTAFRYIAGQDGATVAHRLQQDNGHAFQVRGEHEQLSVGESFVLFLAVERAREHDCVDHRQPRPSA